MNPTAFSVSSVVNEDQDTAMGRISQAHISNDPAGQVWGRCDVVTCAWGNFTL